MKLEARGMKGELEMPAKKGQEKKVEKMAINTKAHHKVSYYLPKGMAKKIKIEAARREVAASKLVETWLRKVMKEEKVR